MPETIPPIGNFRWPVLFARRDQVPDVASSGVVEPLLDVALIYAAIEAARPVTYYAAAQVDTPFTHMIWVRWMDSIDTSFIVVRDLRRLDGTLRRETFRIRRMIEVNGRQRFLRIEAELEGRT